METEGYVQVLSMSVVLICSILDSCVGAPMVVFRSWPAAMDFCCAAGARDLDVILTFDTRPFDALDYVQPLSSLKETWAECRSASMWSCTGSIASQLVCAAKAIGGKRSV